MPIYDYRCGACGREVEVSHGIHEAGPSTCDSCGGPMRKALSAPAIHFKGSGWAKKDARSTTKPASPASTAAGTEGSEGTKSAGRDGPAKAPEKVGAADGGAKSGKGGTGSGAAGTSGGSAD